MITVRIIYTNGTEDIKEVLDVGDICLDGVESIKVIRDERTSRAA
jgi:hypothetical protein